MNLVRGVWIVVASLLFLVPVAEADDGDKKLKDAVEALQKRVEQQEVELARLRAENQLILQQLKGVAGGGATGANPSPGGVTAAAVAQPEAVGESRQAPGRAATERASIFKNDRLQIGGYGSFRFEANDVRNGQFIPGGSATSFTFRRFVVTADAKLTDRLRIYNETELERLLELELEKKVQKAGSGHNFVSGVEGNNGAEIGIEQLWLQFELGKGHGVRAGIVLPPLGRFNILHDDDYWDLPRRTLVDRDAPVLPVKAAWRELGAGLVGSFNVGDTGKLSYQVYALGGSALNFNLETAAETRNPPPSTHKIEGDFSLQAGAVDGSKSVKAVSWRAAYSPSLSGEMALSGYHGRYTPPFLSVKEAVNSIGVDGKWRFGKWDVEGEFIFSDFGDVRRVASGLAQSTAASSVVGGSGDVESEVEFELSGLARRRFGLWTDIKYHARPGWLKKSFLGRGFEDPQLIPILRYERVWLDDNLERLDFAGGIVSAFDFQNRQQDRVTLGLNYRPVQQVGIQFAYEHNQRRRGPGLIFPRVAQSSTNGLVLGMTFSF